MSHDDALAIGWAQLVGIATLVGERELGPLATVDHAQRLARTAMRSLFGPAGGDAE